MCDLMQDAVVVHWKDLLVVLLDSSDVSFRGLNAVFIALKHESQSYLCM